MSVHHRGVILSVHHSKCKYSNLEPQEAESDTLQLQFCLSDLGNACRFCIVLMLHVHCICVGMGSINVVSYISILEKEGNISVIYVSFPRNPYFLSHCKCYFQQ